MKPRNLPNTTRVFSGALFPAENHIMQMTSGTSISVGLSRKTYFTTYVEAIILGRPSYNRRQNFLMLPHATGAASPQSFLKPMS